MVMTALASVAILATLLTGYANRVLVSSSNFSDRAVSVVQSGAVRALIISTVTGHVVAATGGQTSLQPTIEQAVGTALSSAQINREIRRSAASLQSQLMSGTANSLTLTLPDAGPAIAASVGSQSPELAAALRGIGTITVVSVPIPSSDATLVHDAVRAARDWLILLILAVGLALMALVITPHRARTLRRLGIGALVSGLLTVAVYFVGRQLVVDAFSNQTAQAVARGAWSMYVGGLETWGFVLAAIGVLVAAAASVARAPARSQAAYDPLDRTW